MTDKPRTQEQVDWVRKRAYEIWEQEGRPESRDHDHWLKAEAELAAAGPQGNEGEGSRTAALAYDRSQTEYAQQADVTGAAEAARDALEGPEGAELRKAEAAGKARSRGEDPALRQKAAAKAAPLRQKAPTKAAPTAPKAAPAKPKAAPTKRA